jgi:hypothetical protein
MDSIYLVIDQRPGIDSVLVCHTGWSMRTLLHPMQLPMQAPEFLSYIVGQRADQGH